MMTKTEVQEMIKHAAADKAEGRAWSCVCETCGKGRSEGETEELLEVYAAFENLEQTEKRLANFQSFCKKFDL